MKRLIWFLVLVMLFPGPVRAQEGGELKCTDADVATGIEAAIAKLQESQGMSAQEALTLTTEVSSSLGLLYGTCAGLNLSGGKDTVYDIAAIPPGIYRVTLITDGYLHLTGEEIDGDCSDAIGLFNVGEGEASEGLEALFATDDGCTLVWATDNVTAPYTVTFEKMK